MWGWRQPSPYGELTVGVSERGVREISLPGDDQPVVELRPPDSEPVLGRTALLALVTRGTTRIQRIEISGRRIRGSNEIAYLTASYKTTFSPSQGSAPRQARGSHLWILQNRDGAWVVSLVSWSSWD